NGLERDRGEIDHDERNQGPVDPSADAITDGPLFEHLVNAPAQVPEAVACHGAITCPLNQSVNGPANPVSRVTYERRAITPRALLQSPSRPLPPSIHQAHPPAPCRAAPRRPCRRAPRHLS